MNLLRAPRHLRSDVAVAMAAILVATALRDPALTVAVAVLVALLTHARWGRACTSTVEHSLVSLGLSVAMWSSAGICGVLATHVADLAAGQPPLLSLLQGLAVGGLYLYAGGLISQQVQAIWPQRSAQPVAVRVDASGDRAPR